MTSQTNQIGLDLGKPPQIARWVAIRGELSLHIVKATRSQIYRRATQDQLLTQSQTNQRQLKVQRRLQDLRRAWQAYENLQSPLWSRNHKAVPLLKWPWKKSKQLSSFCSIRITCKINRSKSHHWPPLKGARGRKNKKKRIRLRLLRPSLNKPISLPWTKEIN